jgi:predicted phage terminase large subunit-like protein
MKQEPTVRQTVFLATNKIAEVFYGGASGGGKSSALLLAALQYVDEPRYSAILFRRTYADLALPGALMDRATEWLAGTAARWDGKEKTWHFPSGATVRFGYLDTKDDHFRYAGAEFQFVGFDELTQFTEQQYLYLFSRLRRLATASVPIRMRAASNPGGVGHGWVKQRFLIEQHPERLFVPAKLDDNPHLDQESYRKSLDKLDPFTRAQLLQGSWEEYSGGLFRREWFGIVEAAPQGLAKVRYWDLAATEDKHGKNPDYTCGVLMGKSAEGVFYVLDVIHVRASPRSVQNLVVQTAAIDGTAVPIHLEEEPGSSGKTVVEFYTRLLAGYAFYGDKVTGDKATRAQPLSSQAEAGNVKLLRNVWNREFLDELSVFPFGAHDDIVDATSGAFGKLALSPYKRLAVFI